MAAALWATSLRRCRSLGKTTSCLPAAFAAFTAYATPQMSPWLMYDNDQRRSCSTAVAPQEIPVHDRYPEETKPPALSRLIPNLVDYEDLKKHDVRQLQAVIRDPEWFGKKKTKVLRKLRVIPGVLTCLPNNETKCLLLNTVEVERLFHWFGIIGMSAQPYELLLLENGAVHKYPVVLKQWHRDATTNEWENVMFMHMPPGRKTQVEIPVYTEGEEESPGWKKGGFARHVRAGVRVEATWDALPRNKGFLADISGMDTFQRIWIKDLPLPPNVKVVEKHMEHPIVKMTGKREWKDEDAAGA